VARLVKVRRERPNEAWSTVRMAHLVQLTFLGKECTMLSSLDETKGQPRRIPGERRRCPDEASDKWAIKAIVEDPINQLSK
jgi:hypothetical protein